MAGSVPCVSTDVGKARSLIGDTGHLVPKADPMALAQAIGELLNLAPDSRAHLSAAARQRIEETFAFDAVVAAAGRCRSRRPSRTDGDASGSRSDGR